MSSSSETSTSAAPDSQPTRRRGRPRRDWRQNDAEQETVASKECCQTTFVNNINLNDAELLLHFTHHTAESIDGESAAINHLCRFWAYNVPRIGLTHRFVMHMVYALSAYHKVYLTAPDDTARRQKFRGLAQHQVCIKTSCAGCEIQSS